jgi:hypothetical protein
MDIQTIIYSYIPHNYKILKFVNKRFRKDIIEYCSYFNIDIQFTLNNIEPTQIKWFCEYFQVNENNITLELLVKNDFINYIKQQKHNLQQLRLITKLAIKYGKINIYEYCLNNGVNISSNDYFNAIDHNQIEFLDYLIEKKDPKRFTNLCNYSITAQKFDALVYLVKKNFRIDAMTSGTAALRGDLNTLQWLDTMNCPINHWTLKCGCHSGDINTVKWLIQTKNLIPNGESLYAACNSKNLDLVIYIKENYNIYWAMEHSVGAAQKNSVDILRYIRETHGIINQETLKYACIGNHNEAIKYIVSIGIKPTKKLLNSYTLTQSTRDLLESFVY